MAFSLGLVFKELISIGILCVPLLLLNLKRAKNVLLRKCLLSNYHVPGTVPNAKNTVINKTKCLSS